MSGKATLKNFKEMLGAAKLPEKIVEICLRGDLAAEAEDLESQIEQAESVREKTNSLGSGSDVVELVERHDALRAEMQDYTFSFRLRALPKREFRALVAEHPPRTEKKDGTDEPRYALDGIFNVNVDSFFDVLVPASIVEPELTGDDYRQLEEKLTDNQFENLSLASWKVNRDDVDIPFLSTASRLTRSSVPE